MKNTEYRLWTTIISVGLFAAALLPSRVRACACGCSVFSVGTSSMFPMGQGATAFANYDYQNQNQNWSGTSSAPAANNDDKDIRTDFVSFGLQYMFTPRWGAQIEVPYDFRYFKGTAENGDIESANWSQLGDIRVQGIYTGFFSDLSAGVTFGLKLPTGSYTFDPQLVDRDTQIGTGSTDVLLGGYYRGHLDRNYIWDWFSQFLLDVPTLIQGEYRPGVELDMAAGVDYRGFSLGTVQISPLAQVIFSERTSDSGAAASPDDTGYQRLLLSPGIEFDIQQARLYADAEFPVYQNFTGNQLAAPVLVKVSVSWAF
jgi:hypothetical protein